MILRGNTGFQHMLVFKQQEEIMGRDAHATIWDWQGRRAMRTIRRVVMGESDFKRTVLEQNPAERKLAMVSCKKNVNHGNQSVLLLVVAAVAMSGQMGGCVSRAIKEGAGAALGAKGVYREIGSMGPKDARPLAGYSNFAMGRVEDDFGGMIPAELISALPGEVTRRLQDAKLPVGGAGKTLVINARVFYYEKDGAMGFAFGNFEEAIAEVHLVDKATGKVVGKSICVGRTTTTSTMGVDKKTEGLSKGIVKWISDRYPEPQE